MTAADRARDNAARFSAAPPAEQPPAARTARVKPVRSSLDLPPARHHALRAREAELMVELGAVRGIRQDVLAGLVHLALTDETTWRKLAAHLAEQRRRT